MKKLSIWMEEKFWVTPAVYSMLAVLLTIVMFYVDVHYAEKLEPYIPSILMTDVSLAQTILNGLSAALLAMTTFTFSTVMVVLTTYSSQFSPRTLKNFVRDKVTWRVLGVFMGGFIYSTLSLLLMSEILLGQTVLAATVGILISLVCLFFFAAFVHHVSTEIQISNLIDELAADAEQVIKEYTKLPEKNETAGREIKKNSKKWIFKAQTHGYIQMIHFKELVFFAQENSVTIEINVHVGDFIHDEKVVLIVYSEEKLELQVEKFIVTGKEPDTRQDPEYALQKLVEVSLRAISPAVNDPNTAIHNIRQLGRLLGKVSYFPDQGGIFYDDKNVARVTYPVHSFSEVLYKTFFQIRHYGKADISIMAAITDALAITSEIASEQAQPDIWNLQLYLIEGMEPEKQLSLDRDFYQQKVDRLAKLTGNETVKLPVRDLVQNNAAKKETEEKQ